MYTKNQTAEYHPNPEELVGEATISLCSWNPAFSLANIQFPDGRIVKDVHVGGKAHLELYSLFHGDKRSFREGLKQEENLWEITLVKIYHGIDKGPNHCGLEIEEIEWVGGPSLSKKSHKRLKNWRMGLWESLLKFFKVK